MDRRFRYLILALMTAAALFCGTMIPHININEDMTEYLPSDSRMKMGLDTLKSNFPDLDLNAYMVQVMMGRSDDAGGQEDKLTSFDGVAGITATRENDDYVLYTLSVEKGANPKSIQAEIEKCYGDDVTVETNANSNMPDNMVPILIVGVILIFGILFLMCSSFVEALLFILTIGLAVAINMGTNALLPSVSMMTNTIVAVLQMVLSMDYSIILTNRFRQERVNEPDIDKAMHKALVRASSSILSSSLTTIVGLLALVFMKFRIGLDLGIVLAKGVLCSLVSIYTILPALVILFDKAIRATEKRVFLIRTDNLARFEMRFRIPLFILFITLFVSSFFLQQKTRLSFASIWESEIAEQFPPQNVFMLLYDTSEEDKVISLIDSLAENDKVTMALSWPSILDKKYSASEMVDNIGELTSMLPGGSDEMAVDSTMLNEHLIKILFYAFTHPVRNEKLSFGDMEELAEEASKNGMLPEGIDVNAIAQQYIQTPAIPDQSATQHPAAQEIIPDKGEPEPANPVNEADSTAGMDAPAVPAGGIDSVRIQPDVPSETVHSQFTYENCTAQLSCVSLAGFLGFDSKLASTIYRMADRKGDNSTMSPEEFIRFTEKKIMNNRLFKALISKDQREDFAAVSEKIRTAVAAGPLIVEAVQAEAQDAVSDTLRAQEPVVDSTIAVAEVISTPTPPTPLEALAEMAFSGKKYSAATIYRALKNAGINVEEDMVRLLFLYYGSQHNYDESTKLSVGEMVGFLTEEILADKAFDQFIDTDTRQMLSSMDSLMEEGLGSLRKERYSMAAVVTEYPIESDETFKFIRTTQKECGAVLDGYHCLIGESVMYNEMALGFSHELMVVTIITVLSIFLIVAIAFRSLVIPIVLVMTVMTGVYVNVYVSGISGSTMLYLAYLIVQSILMGATIDYGILFTNYYRDLRRGGAERLEALTGAYRGSIHTIMTSGLIIVTAPFIMSVLLSDPTLKSILGCLSAGALAAIILILFILPATLSVCDKIIIRRQYNNKQ